MRAIHTWMFIAFSILMAAGLSANAEEAAEGREIRVTLTSTIGSKIALGVSVGSSENSCDVVQQVAIICNRSLVMQTTADLLFPNDQGQFDFENYAQGNGTRAYAEQKPAYRRFSAEDSERICKNPSGQLALRIKGPDVVLEGKRSYKVQSFNFTRYNL